jgi:Circadian oscillating protein COP23
MRKINLSFCMAICASIALASCSSPKTSELDDTSGAVGARPSDDSVTYICEKDEKRGFWTTYAVSGRGGPIPIIEWDTKAFVESGYDPKTRCDLVTGRLQKFEDMDILDTLKVAYFNNHPVMFVVENQGIAEVTSDTILMTFVPGMTIDQVEQKISQLFSMDNHVSGPLRNSAMEAFYYDENGTIAINFGSYLQSVEIPADSNSD